MLGYMYARAGMDPSPTNDSTSAKSGGPCSRHDSSPPVISGALIASQTSSFPPPVEKDGVSEGSDGMASDESDVVLLSPPMLLEQVFAALPLPLDPPVTPAETATVCSVTSGAAVAIAASGDSSGSRNSSNNGIDAGSAAQTPPNASTVELKKPQKLLQRPMQQMHVTRFPGYYQPPRPRLVYGHEEADLFVHTAHAALGLPGASVAQPVAFLPDAWNSSLVAAPLGHFNNHCNANAPPSAAFLRPENSASDMIRQKPLGNNVGTKTVDLRRPNLATSAHAERRPKKTTSRQHTEASNTSADPSTPTATVPLPANYAASPLFSSFALMPDTRSSPSDAHVPAPAHFTTPLNGFSADAEAACALFAPPTPPRFSDTTPRRAVASPLVRKAHDPRVCFFPLAPCTCEAGSVGTNTATAAAAPTSAPATLREHVMGASIAPSAALNTTYVGHPAHMHDMGGGAQAGELFKRKRGRPRKNAAPSSIPGTDFFRVPTWIPGVSSNATPTYGHVPVEPIVVSFPTSAQANITTAPDDGHVHKKPRRSNVTVPVTATVPQSALSPSPAPSRLCGDGKEASSTASIGAQLSALQNASPTQAGHTHAESHSREVFSSALISAMQDVAGEDERFFVPIRDNWCAEWNASVQIVQGGARIMAPVVAESDTTTTAAILQRDDFVRPTTFIRGVIPPDCAVAGADDCVTRPCHYDADDIDGAWLAMYTSRAGAPAGAKVCLPPPAKSEDAAPVDATAHVTPPLEIIAPADGVGEEPTQTSMQPSSQSSMLPLETAIADNTVAHSATACPLAPASPSGRADAVDAAASLLACDVPPSGDVPNEPLTQDVFERLIWMYERAAWEGIVRTLAASETLADFDEDASCDVCQLGDVEDSNEIVFCDGCDIAVHQACYGVTLIPEGSWLCAPCAAKDTRPSCVLCPNKGGALKPVESKYGELRKWAHVSCALWIPEVLIGNAEKMEPIVGVDRVPSSRRSLVCCLCERRGACIQCHVKRCTTSFHVTCSQRSGLTMVVRETASGGVAHEAFCPRHGCEPTASDVRGMPASKIARIRRIEENFHAHAKPSRVAASVGCSVTDARAVWGYWVSRRKERGGKALVRHFSDIVRRREQGDSGVPKKKSAIKSMRRNLLRLRELCGAVGERDKKDRQRVADAIAAVERLAHANSPPSCVDMQCDNADMDTDARMETTEVEAITAAVSALPDKSHDSPLLLTPDANTTATMMTDGDVMEVDVLTTGGILPTSGECVVSATAMSGRGIETLQPETVIMECDSHSPLSEEGSHVIVALPQTVSSATAFGLLPMFNM